MANNNMQAPQRVGETEPSRPGIKFVLCAVGALILFGMFIFHIKI